MQRFLSFALFAVVYVTGIQAQGDFQCPELMGRYQDPFDCSKFYVCSYGTPHQFSCDNGTRYDHDIGVCRHAADVICRTGNQLMTEAFTCPTMNGMYRDTTSCNHFYLCANGRHFRLACPPGLQFNGAVCTWKSANGCKGGLGFENEVSWKEDLKIPDNDIDKEELPMYKGSFETSNNDVEFENEYYDSTPEEGGSDFPRFVEKVKTMDDIDSIQIGLLAPKGKKMSAETTDRSKPNTPKITTKKTTTTSKTTTTPRPRPSTTPKKVSRVQSTTKKAATMPKKTNVLSTQKTTPKSTPTPKSVKSTPRAETNVTLSSASESLNDTTDSANTTLSAPTTSVSSKKDNKTTKDSRRRPSSTAQTMKAVKYDGAKSLMSSTKPKSTTMKMTSTTKSKSTSSKVSDKTTITTVPSNTTSVPTTTANSTDISADNTTTVAENVTVDTNSTESTDNSTFLAEDEAVNATLSSTVNQTSASTPQTTDTSRVTTEDLSKNKKEQSDTMTTAKVSKAKSSKETAAPSKRKVTRSANKGKKNADVKFRLDTVQLKQ